MADAVPVLHDIQHVTPIACPACETGRAHLTRRYPNPYSVAGHSEIWLFKCANCHRQYTQTVET